MPKQSKVRQCKTCRHWNNPITLSPPGWGSCKMASSDCTLPTLAKAEDWENYAAWLRTAPEFGCLQWEAKDDAQAQTDRTE